MITTSSIMDPYQPPSPGQWIVRNVTDSVPLDWIADSNFTEYPLECSDSDEECEKIKLILEKPVVYQISDDSDEDKKKQIASPLTTSIHRRTLEAENNQGFGSNKSVNIDDANAKHPIRSSKSHVVDTQECEQSESDAETVVQLPSPPSSTPSPPPQQTAPSLETSVKRARTVQEPSGGKVNFLHPKEVLAWALEVTPKYIMSRGNQYTHVPIRLYEKGNIDTSTHLVHILLRQGHYYTIYTSPDQQVVADGLNLCLNSNILEDIRKTTGLSDLWATRFDLQECVGHGPSSACYLAAEFCRLALRGHDVDEEILVSRMYLRSLVRKMRLGPSERIKHNHDPLANPKCHRCQVRCVSLKALRAHANYCGRRMTYVRPEFLQMTDSFVNDATIIKPSRPSHQTITADKNIESTTILTDIPQERADVEFSVESTLNPKKNGFNVNSECAKLFVGDSLRCNPQIAPKRVLQQASNRWKTLLAGPGQVSIPVELFDPTKMASKISTPSIDLTQARVYLLLLQNRWFVVYISKLGDQFIADGLNLCKDESVLAKLKEYTGLDKLRPVYFYLQTNIDHDASSACAIATEFRRVASRNEPVGEDLKFSPSRLKSLSDSFYLQRSQPWHQVKDYREEFKCARCLKRFTKILGLRSHQRVCGTKIFSRGNTREGRQLSALYRDGTCFNDPSKVLEVLRLRISRDWQRDPVIPVEVYKCQLQYTNVSGIYLYNRNGHYFVIFIDGKGQSFVSDGRNKVKTRAELCDKIRAITGLPQLKPVEFYQQRCLNTDAASAIVIAEEFYRITIGLDKDEVGDEIIVNPEKVAYLDKVAQVKGGKLNWPKCSVICEKCGKKEYNRHILANHKYSCYEINLKTQYQSETIEPRKKKKKKMKRKKKSRKGEVPSRKQATAMPGNTNQTSPIDFIKTKEVSRKEEELITLKRICAYALRISRTMLNPQSMKPIPIEIFTSGRIDPQREAIYLLARKKNYYAIYVSSKQQVVADGLNKSQNDVSRYMLMHKACLRNLKHVRFSQQVYRNQTASSAVMIAAEMRRLASYDEKIGKTIVTRPGQLKTTADKLDPIGEDKLEHRNPQADNICVCGLQMDRYYDFFNHQLECLRNRFKERETLRDLYHRQSPEPSTTKSSSDKDSNELDEEVEDPLAPRK